MGKLHHSVQRAVGAPEVNALIGLFLSQRATLLIPRSRSAGSPVSRDGIKSTWNSAITVLQIQQEVTEKTEGRVYLRFLSCLLFNKSQRRSLTPNARTELRRAKDSTQPATSRQIRGAARRWLQRLLVGDPSLKQWENNLYEQRR
jgi:hypothetical protein